MSNIVTNQNMSDLFSTIDSDKKAYVLGYISSTQIEDGSNIMMKSIDFSEKDQKHLETVVGVLGMELKHRVREDGYISLEFGTNECITDIIHHLLDGNLKDGTGECREFIKPTFHDNESLLRDFIRGVVDRYGEITLNSKCTLPTRYESVVNLIDNNFTVSDGKITWYGPATIDFLGKIYMDGTIYKFDKMSNYDIFTKIANSWKQDDNTIGLMPSFKWSRSLPDAIAPVKSNTSDTGFDLHLLKEIKVVGNVHYFDTGIKVEPSPGFYFELVGRSSISKTGWTIANNIVVIDTGYRGSIIAALLKTRDDTPPLSLPIKLVQLIPRPLVIMKCIPDDDMTTTSRGEGGFGSTNN